MNTTLNYNEQNEAVRGCIDEIERQFAEYMRHFPLSWIECAYNRALMIMLDEIEKKESEK